MSSLAGGSSPLGSLAPLWGELGPRSWWDRQGRAPWLPEGVYLKLKRWMDISLCLLALPPVVLVLALCWVAVKLDSRGAFLFSQERTGKGGKRFRMYKIRTMVANAEELKQQLLDKNELSYPDFKMKDDPRITRVGKFLRRSSLDELPQLFNVLMGDMSLVGPRPTSFGAETYRLWHTARLDVKPGITGLWQVSGRSELDFDERLRLDIAYIQNRCLSLDLRILFRTVSALWDGRGAA